MAIKQTVVFTNSAASFTNIDQALASMNAALVDITQKEELDTRNVAGEFTADVLFDQSTQTVTINRTWLSEANFNSYKANWPGEGPNKISFEQAGWICSPETTEVI